MNTIDNLQKIIKRIFLGREMVYRSYLRDHTNTSPSRELRLGGNVEMAHDDNRYHGRSAIESCEFLPK